MYGRVSAFCVILSLLEPAGADSLVLRDGDRLKGQLLQIQDETLVFRTELAGQVIVPLDEVRSITATRSIVFELTSGQTIPATLHEADGQHYLLAQDGRVRLTIALSDIQKTAALPYDTSAAEDSSDSLLDSRWQLSGEVGVSAHTGTEDYIAPYARIALRREAENFDFSSYLRFEMEETAEIPDHVRAALEINLPSNSRWYPQIYTSFDRNIDEGRQLHADVGVGVEGSLHEGDKSRLTAAAGLGVGIERLDTSHLIDEGSIPPARDREHDQENLDLRLQLRYTRNLYAGALWEKRLELYPSLTDLGELRARYETAFWVPLTPRLKLKLDASVMYDNERQLKGLHEWESTVGASVSVDF